MQENGGGKWLTVKEFAEIVHVSTQRLYTLMNSKSDKGRATALQRHCKQENGSRYIHSDAIALFPVAKGLQTAETGENTQIISDEQPVSVAKGLQTGCNGESVPDQQQQSLDELTEQLEQARSEIEKISSENASLNEVVQAERKRADESAKTVSELSARVSELTAAVTSLTESHKALTEQLAAAQALHAGTMQKLLDAKSEPHESSVQSSSAKSADVQSEPQEDSVKDVPETVPEREEHKRGFFKFLFRKRSKS